MRRIHLDIESITFDYLSGVSGKELAKKHHVCDDVIYNRLAANGIKRTVAEAHTLCQIPIDVKPLAEEYKKGVTLDELSRRVGTTIHTLKKNFRREGIPLRSWKQAMKLKDKNRENHITLNEGQIKYIEGLLLGDGSIARNRYSASYCHGDKHQIYMIWLRKKLRSFGIKVSTIDKYSDKEMWSFRTAWYRNTFTKMRKVWYPDGRKHLPKKLKITPTLLKNWYIGDGTHHNFVQIMIGNTEFSKREKKEIVIPQLKVVGIDATLNGVGNIYIRMPSAHRFFKYMLSEEKEIPWGYNYKFPDRRVWKILRRKSESPIRKKEFDIKRRLSKRKLIDLYWKKGLGSWKIAKMYGCSSRGITDAMDRLGIPKRPPYR